jgi:adenylate cyclase
LWAERFDRDRTDIFEVRDDVTAHIVSALALNLNAGDRQSIAAEETDNLEAYDSFLRGRELWFQTTKDANREAGTLLRRPIERDPRFAPAYAFLGGSYVIDYANAWHRGSKGLRKPPDTRCTSICTSRMRYGRSPSSPFGCTATKRP